MHVQGPSTGKHSDNVSIWILKVISLRIVCNSDFPLIMIILSLQSGPNGISIWEKTLEIISCFLNHRGIEIVQVIKIQSCREKFFTFKSLSVFFLFSGFFFFDQGKVSNGVGISLTPLYHLLISLLQKQRVDIREPILERQHFSEIIKSIVLFSLYLFLWLPSVLARDNGFHSW